MKSGCCVAAPEQNEDRAPHGNPVDITTKQHARPTKADSHSHSIARLLGRGDLSAVT